MEQVIPKFLGISNASEVYDIVISTPFEGKLLCYEEDGLLIKTILPFIEHGHPRVMIAETPLSHLRFRVHIPIIKYDLYPSMLKCDFCDSFSPIIYSIKRFKDSTFSDLEEECLTKIVDFSEKVLNEIIVRKVKRVFYPFFLFQIRNTLLLPDIVTIIMKVFIDLFQ